MWTKSLKTQILLDKYDTTSNYCKILTLHCWGHLRVDNSGGLKSGGFVIPDDLICNGLIKSQTTSLT